MKKFEKVLFIGYSNIDSYVDFVSEYRKILSNVAIERYYTATDFMQKYSNLKYEFEFANSPTKIHAITKIIFIPNSIIQKSNRLEPYLMRSTILTLDKLKSNQENNQLIIEFYNTLNTMAKLNLANNKKWISNENVIYGPFKKLKTKTYKIGLSIYMCETTKKLFDCYGAFVHNDNDIFVSSNIEKFEHIVGVKHVIDIETTTNEPTNEPTMSIHKINLSEAPKEIQDMIQKIIRVSTKNPMSKGIYEIPLIEGRKNLDYVNGITCECSDCKLSKETLLSGIDTNVIKHIRILYEYMVKAIRVNPSSLIKLPNFIDYPVSVHYIIFKYLCNKFLSLENTTQNELDNLLADYNNNHEFSNFLDSLNNNNQIEEILKQINLIPSNDNVTDVIIKIEKLLFNIYAKNKIVIVLDNNYFKWDICQLLDAYYFLLSFTENKQNFLKYNEFVVKFNFDKKVIYVNDSPKDAEIFGAFDKMIKRQKKHHKILVNNKDVNNSSKDKSSEADVSFFSTLNNIINMKEIKKLLHNISNGVSGDINVPKLSADENYSPNVIINTIIARLLCVESNPKHSYTIKITHILGYFKIKYKLVK